MRKCSKLQQDDHSINQNDAKFNDIFKILNSINYLQSKQNEILEALDAKVEEINRTSDKIYWEM